MSETIEIAKQSPLHAPFLERKFCPGCGASAENATPVRQSQPAAETLPFERHSRFAAGYDTDRAFFTYVQCPACQLQYCPVFYTQDQLEHLYGHQQENMGQVPLSARRAAQNQYADTLLKHVTGDRGFLEIGADIGLFAQYCAKKGSFDHFWLFEPNLEVTEALEEALLGHDKTVLLTMTPGDEVPDNQVSAIALVHVLDHLLEPDKFLEKLHAKLEPGGVMLTVTHNCGSVLARLLGNRFPPYALQHPQLYSPSSIRTLFERAGFEVLETSPTVNFFPLLHLVRAVFSIFGLPVPFKNVQGPTIPIRLGNFATVARKRTVVQQDS